MTTNNSESKPLSEMPKEIRETFHASIIKFLADAAPDMNIDWGYNIKHDDLGLAYQLYYFSKPSETSNYVGYMVVARVGAYDVEKNELLPPDQDKIMVFKFNTLEELLCQKNQS